MSAKIEHKTFTKEERLCGKKAIDLLFEKGSSFLVFPFRVVFLSDKQEGSLPVRVAFGVSKKYSKRAVKRNLIRRRMREAFRKNKHTLYGELTNRDKRLMLFISYIAKEETAYAVIEKKMIKAFDRLLSEYKTD